MACILVMTILVYQCCMCHACGSNDWFAAARQGDVEKLQSCVNDGGGGLTAKSILAGSKSVLLKETDEAGCSALVVAAMNNHLDAVKFVHKLGADPEAHCRSGTTALMHASSHGYIDIVKYLKESGVDMHRKLGRRGWCAATYAARNGHFATLEYLHNLHIELDGPWRGGALHWAAANGDIDLLHLKIKEEGPQGIDTPDTHGFSAAFWAARTGNLETLKILHESGASLKMRSPGDMTMLMAAAYAGRIEVLAYLLEQGLSPDSIDANGWTAIMWAAANGNLQTIKVLETAHACVKPKEGNWDPLMVAAASGHTNVVEWFLAKDIPYNSVNHEEKTASDLARKNGHQAIADLIDQMTTINKIHNEHHKNGRMDAAARYKSLQNEAKRLAREAENEELEEQELKRLVEKHADFERIARLRDVQRMHRRTLTLQREKEMDQRKVFQNIKNNAATRNKARNVRDTSEL